MVGPMYVLCSWIKARVVEGPSDQEVIYLPVPQRITCTRASSPTGALMCERPHIKYHKWVKNLIHFIYIDTKTQWHVVYTYISYITCYFMGTRYNISVNSINNHNRKTRPRYRKDKSWVRMDEPSKTKGRMQVHEPFSWKSFKCPYLKYGLCGLVDEYAKYIRTFRYVDSVLARWTLRKKKTWRKNRQIHTEATWIFREGLRFLWNNR